MGKFEKIKCRFALQVLGGVLTVLVISLAVYSGVNKDSAKATVFDYVAEEGSGGDNYEDGDENKDGEDYQQDGEDYYEEGEDYYEDGEDYQQDGEDYQDEGESEKYCYFEIKDDYECEICEVD